MKRQLIIAFAIVMSLLAVTAMPVSASHGPVVVSNHTTDSDFNAGTLSGGMEVEGSGDSAVVTVDGGPTTETFDFTGSEQTWQVPLGIDSVTVELFGAGTSADGGYVKGNLSVTPGETLRIYVGGEGTSSESGFNGGGNGPGSAEGGAGATDVRQGGSALSDRVAVAGGAGGNGDGSLGPNGNGGQGGADTGESGTSGDLSGGGGGGTQSAGGSGGSGGGSGGDSGDDGSLGQGGGGGSGTASGNNGRGGGGGGGYYGGGGGGACAAGGCGSGSGGGGGSNYDDGLSSVDSNERGTGNSGNGQAKITYNAANPSATYISQNHSVEGSVGAEVNITEITNGTVTVTFEGWDGSSWTQLDQTTGITTTGVKQFSWSEFTTSNKVRTNVTVINTSGSGGVQFTMSEEGVEATTVAPAVDNSSASPTGTLDTATPTLEIDINDSDFAKAHGDSVEVEFFVGGSSVGTDTLTSNGTASVTVSSALTGGDHTWNATATDDYGHSNTSQDFTISTPANITIRNVTENHPIIQSATVEVIIAGSDDTVDRQTVTDGNVSLAGLPTDVEYVLVVETDDYHRRTVIVEDVFDQSDVFLLNTSFTSVENTFNIDDQTGQFEGENTSIIIQKPINRSVYDSNFAEEYQWVDVAGDRIGADGTYTVDLEQGDRYRIIVDNNDGNRRILGEYQAETAGTVTLRIGDLTFDVGADGETYEYSGSFSDSNIQFNYTDPDDDTSSLRVKIYESGNQSNEIYNQSHSSLGTLSITHPISGDQTNTTWVIEFSGTRGGESVNGKLVVGASNLGPGVPLSSAWKERIAFSLLLLITGLTAGGFNAEMGSVAAALTGGMLWWTGWLPAEIGGGVVVLALFIAGAMTLSTRGGEEIQ